MGSPASASSSTTDPWPNCKMYLIGTLVRPNSTDSCTGMSSTRSMSVIGPSADEVENGRTASPASGPPWSASVPPFCSSSASAQAAIGSSSAGLLSSVDMMFLSPNNQIVASEAFVDANRVLGIVRPILALENGNATDIGLNFWLPIQLDKVTRLHRQQLFNRGVSARQFRHQRHRGGLNFTRQQFHPAPINLHRVSL